MKEQRHFEPTSIVLLSLSLGSNLFCPLVLSPGGGGREAQADGGGEHAEQYIWQGYALLQQWTDTTDGGERRREGGRQSSLTKIQKAERWARDKYSAMGQNEREGAARWPAYRLCLSVLLSVFGPYLAMEMGRNGWQSISPSCFPMVLARLPTVDLRISMDGYILSIIMKF